MKSNVPSSQQMILRAHCPMLQAIAAVATIFVGLCGASSRADILYASKGNTIVKITNDGTSSIFAGTGLDIPRGLAFDTAGNLYVANAGSGTILRITPGGISSVFGTTGFPSLHGLAFDGAGNLYAADGAANRIEKFSPTGAYLGAFATSGLYGPEHLAFDSVGNLFVANNMNATIEKFAPTGTDLGIFATTGPHSIGGLAFDGTGNLYVADTNNGWIQKYTPGGAGTVFGTRGFASDLAFDSGGNLYAANFGLISNIEKIDTGGNGSIFASGGGFVKFLAFTNDAGVPLPLANQAPEPTTLALAAMGSLALLGRNTRRRRD